MEKISEALKRVQAGSNLPKSQNELPKRLQSNDKGEIFISVYSSELTSKTLTQSLAKIKAAFPVLPPDYLIVLSDMFIENGFGDKRLEDAVNHVIKSCVYPQPTIASFIGFDKKVKLFTYNDMCKKVDESGSGVWQYHENIKINDITYWYLKNESINLE